MAVVRYTFDSGIWILQWTSLLTQFHLESLPPSLVCARYLASFVNVVYKYLFRGHAAFEAAQLFVLIILFLALNCSTYHIGCVFHQHFVFCLALTLDFRYLHSIHLSIFSTSLCQRLVISVHYVFCQQGQAKYSAPHLCYLTFR